MASAQPAATMTTSSSSATHAEGRLPSGIPRDAAVRVMKGALAATTASFTYGSIIATLRAQPAVAMGTHYGFNMFTFAFPFFGLREYVVNPLLADARATFRHSTEPIEPGSIHARNLISSAISGSLVGGGLAGYLRGREKIFGGARTLGFCCFGIQLLGNELRYLRVRILNAYTDAATGQRKPVKSQVWDWLKSISPVKKLSDEQYEARLLKTRDHLWQAARELDDAILAEQRQERHESLV